MMGAVLRFAAFAAALAIAFAHAQEDLDARPAAAAAEGWLQLLDTGRYGESWEAATPLFREETAKVRWETTVEGVRGPLGVVISRKLRSATYSRGPGDLSDRHFFVIQYDTRFEHRPLSTEIVTPMRGPDGVWRVAAYVLR